MARRIGVIVASIVVSGLFLWIALRGIETDQVLASLARANLAWFLAGLAVAFVGIYTRAIRWRGLLNFRLSTTRAFYMMGVTFVVNLLPLRLGEVARSLLATRDDVPFMTAATSVVVERLLDTLLVVILLAAAITQLPDVPPTVTQSSLLFGVAAVLGFVVLLLLARFPDFAHRLLRGIQSRVPFLERLPLGDLLDNVIEGLQPLIRPAGLAHALVWTLISWALSLISLYLTQLSLGIVGPGALLNSVLALTLASFSIAIPVTVASLGPFQAAFVLAGDMSRMELEAALFLSLGFLFHGLTIINYFICGIIGFSGLGVGFAEIVRASSKRAAEPEGAN